MCCDLSVREEAWCAASQAFKCMHSTLSHRSKTSKGTWRYKLPSFTEGTRVQSLSTRERTHTIEVHAAESGCQEPACGFAVVFEMGSHCQVRSGSALPKVPTCVALKLTYGGVCVHCKTFRAKQNQSIHRDSVQTQVPHTIVPMQHQYRHENEIEEAGGICCSRWKEAMLRRR
jgi:hypothetical protein